MELVKLPPGVKIYHRGRCYKHEAPKALCSKEFLPGGKKALAIVANQEKARKARTADAERRAANATARHKPEPVKAENATEENGKGAPKIPAKGPENGES